MRYAIFLSMGLVGCSGSQADGAVTASDDASVADAVAADALAPRDATARPPHEAGVVAIDSGTDAGATACADLATPELCASCCVKNDSSGHDVLDKALFACACKTEHCASACATSICGATPSPPDAGDPCTVCIQASMGADAGDAGCGGEVSSACIADVDCTAYEQCVMGCGGHK